MKRMPFDKLPCMAVCRGTKVKVLKLNDAKNKALIQNGPEKRWAEIWVLEPLTENT